MSVGRRGQAIRVPSLLVNWQQEAPTDSGEGRQLFMDGTSRVSREAQARFREGFGVKLPGAKRPSTEHGVPLRRNNVHMIRTLKILSPQKTTPGHNGWREPLNLTCCNAFAAAD